MNTTLSAKEKWSKDYAVYDDLGKELCHELDQLLHTNGISGQLSYRSKEVDSIIKKMYRKGKTYEEIHDKVGARVVVQFKDQLSYVDRLIVDNLGSRVAKREDMASKLGHDSFGYQSIHYDIIKELPSSELVYCELQLRTICQHNWSEMSHSLSYKSEVNVPKDIIREINALSAVFELADNQFQLIQSLIEQLPDTHPVRVLNFLEKLFFKHIGSYYDKELSTAFVSNIAKLYPQKNTIQLIQSFVEQECNPEKIATLISSKDISVFFSQPEIFIILERLQNAKYDMSAYWTEHYDIEELEIVANRWGCSIE